MFCTRCGKENSEEAQFCSRCGMEFVDSPDAGIELQKRVGAPSAAKPVMQVRPLQSRQTPSYVAAPVANTTLGMCG